jgi:Fe-S cluster biogenesis protein NfuA
MVPSTHDQDFRDRMQRIETLIREVEQFPDPALQAHTREIIQALLDLQGATLERIFDRIADSEKSGLPLIDALAEDDLIGNVLLLHDLHPLDTESRVRGALTRIQPELATHKATVDLEEVTPERIRVRLRTAGTCASTARTLRTLLETALAGAAPEVPTIVIEEVTPATNGDTFVPIEDLRLRNPVAAVQKPIVAPQDTTERCELCDALLASSHSHLIELATSRLLCSCEPCAILFSDAAGRKYRRVPRRVHFLADFQMTDAQWESLCIPINLAFFFTSTHAGRVVALYPSPAGATESLLGLEAWTDLSAENPVLREIEPDVEALLVNRVAPARDYYRVPIDECYKLVGLLRANWRGLSGGSEVWDAIGVFFAALKERAGSEVAHA